MADTKMIATRGFRYGTRRLKADEDFTANGPTARLYSKLGWARLAEEAGEEPVQASKEPKRRKKKSKA